jgi:hypothetical protein
VIERDHVVPSSLWMRAIYCFWPIPGKVSIILDRVIPGRSHSGRTRNLDII